MTGPPRTLLHHSSLEGTNPHGILRRSGPSGYTKPDDFLGPGTEFTPALTMETQR